MSIQARTSRKAQLRTTHENLVLIALLFQSFDDLTNSYMNTCTEIPWTPMHGYAWSTHGSSMGKVWIQKSFPMDGPSMGH